VVVNQDVKYASINIDKQKETVIIIRNRM